MLQMPTLPWYDRWQLEILIRHLGGYLPKYQLVNFNLWHECAAHLPSPQVSQKGDPDSFLGSI